MNTLKIIAEVNSEIEYWKQNQQNTIKISSQAKEFIYKLIENIKEDPSKLWDDRSADSLNESQKRAIKLISRALSTVKPYREAKSTVTEISYWELIHALSPEILTNLCFIPKKDMK